VCRDGGGGYDWEDADDKWERIYKKQKWASSLQEVDREWKCPGRSPDFHPPESDLVHTPQLRDSSLKSLQEAHFSLLELTQAL
jgi:hypothetical protein